MQGNALRHRPLGAVAQQRDNAAAATGDDSSDEELAVDAHEDGKAGVATGAAAGHWVDQFFADFEDVAGRNLYDKELLNVRTFAATYCMAV